MGGWLYAFKAVVERESIVFNPTERAETDRKKEDLTYNFQLK